MNASADDKVNAGAGDELSAGASDKVNILLVDDQPARLLSYESILSDLGQNLVTARSGDDALQRLMADEFAVVLLDVNMPGMDGFEVAGMIHEHPRFEKTPIIFITGVHVSELDRLRGYTLGAVDYVSIPVVPAILRTKVAVLVELYCQRRELQRLNRSLAEANARLAEAHSTLQAEKTRELEALNATLREANRHKDEFLAMLAHELRNPLASIHNAMQLMRNPQLPAPQLGWAREMIERQLGHLTRLIDDLLDVARITRGKINLAREPVALAAVVARAVETVQPLLTQQGHQLVLDVAREPLYIDGDPTRLIQIVGNILSNAVKYTKAGGRIELTAAAGAPAAGGSASGDGAGKGAGDGELIEIRVRDNGMGIDPALMPEVFNLFAQAQASRLDQGSQTGLGIGLALVKRLVELHGGQVVARSEGSGKGSEFIVRLPRLSHAAAESLARPVRPAAAESLSGIQRCILIADDNRDALESLAQLLQLAGHQVHQACDGLQALAVADEVRPELMLLDIGMPGLDGYEVARRVRAQEWGRSTVLVAVTGWGQDSDRRRSREAGFDSHWVKPLDAHKLAVLLDSLPVAAAAGTPARAAVPGAASVAVRRGDAA
ncbi:MAG TPA: response regulator [Steroidobacteraceae bacterium]|jgi:signal transduction histidine kinase|nr:response regulator [Steroidobacteraceae bacterium]